MTDKRLFTELKKNKQFLLHLIANGLLSFVFSLTFAFLITSVIHDVFLDGQSMKGIVPRLIVLITAVAARAAVSYYYGLYFRKMATRIKNRLLSQYIDTLLDNGPVLTESKTTGGSSSLVVEAAEHIEPYYYDFMPAFFNLMISLPLILLTALYFDFVSCLIMLVTGPVLPFFLYLIGMESEKASHARLKDLTRLGGGLLDILTGLKTLKLYGQGQNARQKVGDMSEGFRKVTMQVLKISFLSAFVLELAATISTAIIAVTLGTRLLYDQIAFFNCFFILLLTPDYFMAIRRFGAKFHVAQNAKSAAALLMSETEVSICDTLHIESPFPSEIKEVRFDQLTYSYGRSIPALQNLTLRLRPGEMTAVVGKSGSGKSTVANILLKLIDPDSGCVNINGTDLKHIDTSDLRKNVSYVPQRPFIFKDTLRNNITLPKPNATPEELDAAIRDALLTALVDSLPEGLETRITDMGLNLSTGERQRIAIARAILKGAPVVIVDEAVSAQDKDNELLLTKAFERLSREKTVLVIAHRLETVKSADRIYMLDLGTVVEEGLHEALMALNGQYSELVRTWEASS